MYDESPCISSTQIYYIIIIYTIRYTNRVCRGAEVTFTNTMRITVAVEYHYREPLPCN